MKCSVSTSPTMATVLGSVIIGGSSSIASAGDDSPVIDVGWAVDGETDGGSLTGEGLGAGIYAYSASTVGDGFEINWSFMVTDNGAAGGFEVLASSLGIVNLSDQASSFEIVASIPVTLEPGFALYGGAIGGNLTGNEGGGYLGNLGDSALFNAAVDGEGIASLIDSPFELKTDPFSSVDLAAESFGDPIPSLGARAAQESMSIGLNFMLGAGDSLAVTSNYVARIPTPGVLSFLGMAPFARRRRRH